MGYRRNIPETRAITATEKIPFDVGSKVLSVSLFVPIGYNDALYGFGERPGNVLSAGSSITITALSIGEDIGILDGSALYIDWDVAATTKLVTVGLLKCGPCLDIE